MFFTTKIDSDYHDRLMVYYDEELLDSHKVDKVWYDQMFLDQLRRLLGVTKFAKVIDMEWVLDHHLPAKDSEYFLFYVFNDSFAAEFECMK